MRRMLAALSWMLACGPAVGGDGFGSSGAEESTGVATSSIGVISSSSPESDAGPADSSAGSSGGATTGGEFECASSWPGLTMLACGSFQPVLASDDALVYGFRGADLVGIPLVGGPELVVAQLESRPLFHHGGVLYWVLGSDGTAGRIMLPDGEIQTFSAVFDNPAGIVADDAAVFVTDYTDAGRVVKIDLESGDGTTLYDGLDHPLGLLLAGEALFVVDSADNANDPTPILEGSVHGSPLVEVVDSGGAVAGLSLRDETFFWGFYSLQASGVRSFDRVNATNVVLAPAPYQVTGSALLGGEVLWSEIGDSGSHSALRAVAIADGATRDLIVDDIIVSSMLSTSVGVVAVLDGEGLARIDP